MDDWNFCSSNLYKFLDQITKIDIQADSSGLSAGEWQLDIPWNRS